MEVFIIIFDALQYFIKNNISLIKVINFSKALVKVLINI